MAFVELDQIGMCMPAPVAARSAAKADNLLGILDNFAAAGAHGVVVSGDLVETMSDLLTQARERPVLCRLHADDAVTVERLTIRGSLHYAMTSSEYGSYDVPPGDIQLTSHPRTPEQVAAEILRRLGQWPPAPTAPDVPPPLAPPVLDDCSAVLVTGPRAVGTSAAAWQVFMRSVASGHRTAYLDLEQLGFLSAALQEATLSTKLANVATCWEGFRVRGAERLVLCGHFDGDQVDAARGLIPSLRVAALTAAPATLLERARRRSRQKDLWLPGDDLFGRDDADVREFARQAATFEPGQADLRVATDGRTPMEIAADVERCR